MISFLVQNQLFVVLIVVFIIWIVFIFWLFKIDKALFEIEKKVRNFENFKQ